MKMLPRLRTLSPKQILSRFPELVRKPVAENLALQLLNAYLNMNISGAGIFGYRKLVLLRLLAPEAKKA